MSEEQQYRRTFDFLAANDGSFIVQNEVIKMRLASFYTPQGWRSFMAATKAAQLMINGFASISGYKEMNCGVVDGICGPKTIAGALLYMKHLAATKSIYVNEDTNYGLQGLFKPGFGVVDPKSSRGAGSNTIYFMSYFGDQSMMCRYHGDESTVTVMESRFNQGVIHDTCTVNAKNCVKVLNGKKNSTHFIIDVIPGEGRGAQPSAIIYQVAPLSSVTYHIGSDNGSSIGIDMVNPIYPSWASGQWKSRLIIDNKYMDGGKMVTYFDIQLKALMLLMKHLSGLLPGLDLKIKNVKHHNGADMFQFGLIEGELANNDPGYVSHQALGSHADGGFALYNVWRMLNDKEIGWSLLHYPPNGANAPQFLGL